MQVFLARFVGLKYWKISGQWCYLEVMCYVRHSSPLRAFWDNQPGESLSYITISFDKNRL